MRSFRHAMPRLVPFLSLLIFCASTTSISSAPPTTTRTKKPPSKSVAPSIFRQSDRRPRHDDQRLAKLGIGRYESQRLILYTDLPAKEAQTLPPLLDAAYSAWEEYFGPLPPDRERSEYQLTGYLMVDQAPFREAGLLPDDLPNFDHGRHRGQEFWLNDQPSVYYREHLLLHEGTHCYTTSVEHGLLPRVWYIEGIAEHFGTHRRLSDGTTEFRILPDVRADFPNLGRIKLIEEYTADRPPLSLKTVSELPSVRFSQPDAYAWSWGLCHFLDQHPRHGERFQKATRVVVAGGADDELRRLLSEPDLAREWEWFSADLCHGYDLSRAAIDVRHGESAKAGSGEPVKVTADRGWQSSGWLLKAGERYRLKAKGRFLLAKEPKPWVSEPAGVSIRYHAGLPLGRLVGRLWPNDARSKGSLKVLDLGSTAEISVEEDATLYLRLNDAWNELADNEGTADVWVENSR